MKKSLKVIISIAATALGVLSYGYWHAISHGTSYIELVFETPDADKTDRLSNAEVVFLDADDNILAKGRRDEKYHFIHLIHPSAGDCHRFTQGVPPSKEAKKSWYECFEKQSTWIPTWMNDVRQVQIKHSACLSKPLPITISAHNNEWFLWWVPHPHIGGLPSTYFRSRIIVSAKDCVRWAEQASAGG